MGTTMGVFGDVSSAFASVYATVMTVSTRIDSLKVITKYFNMATDVNDYKKSNATCSKAMKDSLEQLSRQTPRSGLVMDLIPIELRNVSFAYSVKSKNEKQIFQNASISIPQGKVVAIVGKHGSGKTALLRLLSRTIFPQVGDVVMPTCLQLLYVARTPILLDRTPLENLIFGRPMLKDMKLVINILTELQVEVALDLVKEEELNADLSRSPSRKSSRGRLNSRDREARNLSYENLDHRQMVLVDDAYTSGESESDTEANYDSLSCFASLGEVQEEIHLNSDFSWHDRVGSAEMAKISIARAMIVNPDVMLLHSPLQCYNRLAQDEILAAVRKHVANRGLSRPEDTVGLRGPRTVFFTPESADQAKMGDIVLQINHATGKVYEIPKNTVQEGFVH